MLIRRAGLGGIHINDVISVTIFSQRCRVNHTPSITTTYLLSVQHPSLFIFMLVGIRVSGVDGKREEGERERRDKKEKCLGRKN